MPFPQFWAWLEAHHNCILRAGTPDVMLFDHDDYHWHLLTEDDTLAIVQLVRGKELVGELFVMTQEISYVQVQSSDTDEHVFECVVEGPQARETAYHFVMAHSYEDEASESVRHWTH